MFPRLQVGEAEQRAEASARAAQQAWREVMATHEQQARQGSTPRPTAQTPASAAKAAAARPGFPPLKLELELQDDDRDQAKPSPRKHLQYHLAASPSAAAAISPKAGRHHHNLAADTITPAQLAVAARSPRSRGSSSIRGPRPSPLKLKLAVGAAAYSADGLLLDSPGSPVAVTDIN